VSNPLDLLAGLAYPLVAGVADLVSPLFGSSAAAAAIVLSTVAIRLVLLPVAVAQHRADTSRTALMARAAAIREKHKRRPQRLEAELAKLYRTEGAGLLRGFLPVLVQLPVFAGMFRLFVSPTVHGHGNALLQQTLFSTPLGVYLLSAGLAHLGVFAAVLALLAVVGFLTSRVMRGTGAPAGFAGVIVRVMPYASVVAALFLPLGASLYLLTTTAWTTAQTAVLRNI
jgi:YidC/Oxa1 family membrane protein insertase